MNSYEIRNFVKQHGAVAFEHAFGALLEGATLPNGAKIKRQPHEFSIRELWEGLVGPVEWVTNPPSSFLESGGLDPTGFPTVTEKLLASVMIPSYQAEIGVSNVLVPQSYSPKTLTEQFPGFTYGEGAKPIPTGDEYPVVGFGDKYASFQQALHNRKEGFEIRINEETIRFDQTGQILRIAQDNSGAMATELERRTVRAVLGIGSDSGTTLGGVYYPNGVDTALYRAAAFNYRTDAVPLYVDPAAGASNSQLQNYTDLAEVMTIHATLIKDDRLVGDARPITWRPNILLVPNSLAPMAANVLAATGITYMPQLGGASTPEIRQMSQNPLGVIFNGQLPQPVTSTFVDEVSQRKWVMYDNRRSFVRVVVFPLQTFRAPSGYMWNRDVVFAMRMREWSRVIAIEHRNTMMSGDPT